MYACSFMSPAHIVRENLNIHEYSDFAIHVVRKIMYIYKLESNDMRKEKKSKMCIVKHVPGLALLAHILKKVKCEWTFYGYYPLLGKTGIYEYKHGSSYHYIKISLLHYVPVVQEFGASVWTRALSAVRGRSCAYVADYVTYLQLRSPFFKTHEIVKKQSFNNTQRPQVVFLSLWYFFVGNVYLGGKKLLSAGE